MSSASTVATHDDHLSSFVRREDIRVLDIGCGPGERGARLKGDDPARVVWGIEHDPNVAMAARGRLDRVIGSDPERMIPSPLPNAFFECILLDHQLERLSDPVLFLRCMRRHLATGGRIVIRASNGGHWSVIQALLSGFPVQSAEELGRTVGLLTPERVRGILFEAGYRLVSEHTGTDANSQIIDPLTTAAAQIGVDPKQARRSLEGSESIFIAAPLQPVVDHKTVGQLGPATLKGVSVVVLTYNSAKTIGSCLASVLKTLGPEDELIVVDNNSRDDTVERVDKLLAAATSVATLPNPRSTIRNSENLGFSAGCNVGIRASCGTYICLLNPDTEVWPGWLGSLASRLLHPEVGMVGPLSDNVAGSQFVGHWIPFKEANLSPAALAEACRDSLWGSSHQSRLIIGLCAMLRRETLNRTGLLDENLFLGSDDLEMSWRLRTHGLTLQVAQDVFVHHIGGQSFATEDRAVLDRQLFDSTEALLAKVSMVLGWRAPDRLLWGFDITHQRR